MWLMSDIEAVEHPRRRLTCRHDKKPSPRPDGDGFFVAEQCPQRTSLMIRATA